MNTKLNFAAGIANIILAAALIVNTCIILLCIIACVAVSALLPILFLPFLLAVPIFGFIFLVSLSSTVCNLVAGVGTVIAFVNGGGKSKIFAVISIVVDAVFIPANVLFFAYGVFAVKSAYEVNGLTVMIVVASAVAAVLTVVSLVLNAVSLRTKKES